MSKIIGSKMAAELAKKKFGERAFVARSGKQFYVGTFRIRFWNYIIDRIHGTGKSWETALINAGISVPQEVIGLPTVEMIEDKVGM